MKKDQNTADIAMLNEQFDALYKNLKQKKDNPSRLRQLWGDETHQSKTIEWLLKVFPDKLSKVAYLIAEECCKVDYSNDTNPEHVWSTDAQSWHFNTNDNEHVGQSAGDSRIILATKSINDAVEESISHNNPWVPEVAKKLGMGLHALQDCFAHSDEFVTQIKPYLDHILLNPILLSIFNRMNGGRFYTHANKHGWHADDMNVHDYNGLDLDEKNLAVPETKESPIYDDVSMLSGKRYNGRLAITRLATWIYLGAWAWALRTKTGAVIGEYNEQLDKMLGCIFNSIEKDVNEWKNHNHETPALSCLKGFMERCMKVELGSFFDQLRLAIIEDKKVSLKTIISNSRDIKRPKVAVSNFAIEALIDAYNYSVNHTADPDWQQVEAVKTMLKAIKGDAYYLKIKCGDNKWLGLDKDGWACIVNNKENAINLAIVEIGEGLYSLIVGDLFDNNGIYKVLGCSSSGYVGIYSYNEATPWQLKLAESDKHIRLTLSKWPECLMVANNKNFLCLVNESDKSKYDAINKVSFSLHVSNKYPDNCSYSVVKNLNLMCGDNKWLGLDESDFAVVVSDKALSSNITLVEVGKEKYSIFLGDPNHGLYKVLDCKNLSGAVGAWPQGETNAWWVSCSVPNDMHLGSAYHNNSEMMLCDNGFFYVLNQSKYNYYQQKTDLCFAFAQLAKSNQQVIVQLESEKIEQKACVNQMARSTLMI